MVVFIYFWSRNGFQPSTSTVFIHTKVYIVGTLVGKMKKNYITFLNNYKKQDIFEKQEFSPVFY